MAIRRILIPCNKSKLSTKALEKAIELSSSNQTEIFILYVINEIPLSIHYSNIESKNNEILISPIVDKSHEEIKNELTEIPGDLKEKYTRDNITITTEIKIGAPVEEIAR
ncbi:universal stress protein [Candidatus Nitrosocosmicus franklandus]|uniref:Stress response protein NhaX n=1 Tax=Candidatus Nitrosocosmicus franklandianus TaxID=1798806 RepID=A0A484IBM9_9ARCH